MNIIFPLKITTILIPIAAGSCINNHDEHDTKPNIIIIYTDDVGYGDIGCYGATLVNTPNIDKLASNGLKIHQCLCSLSHQHSFKICPVDG